MKTMNKLLMVIFIALTFASCSDDDNGPALLNVESKTAKDIPAPQTGGQGQEPAGGTFTKFSFKTGKVTTSETEWDLAFRGTTILVNGGAVTGANEEPARNGKAGVAMKTGTFASVTSADGLKFNQDADGTYAIPSGSDNGWYNYAGPPTHAITPVPGRIFVVKTHDGKYAKIDILSYYKDAPAKLVQSSESKYYTFNYVYNPNAGETSL